MYFSMKSYFSVPISFYLHIVFSINLFSYYIDRYIHIVIFYCDALKIFFNYIVRNIELDNRTFYIL